MFVIGLLVFTLNFLVSAVISNFFDTDALGSFLYLIIVSQYFLSATIAACTFVIVKTIKNNKDDKDKENYEEL